jgi:hypothetical protein
MILKKPLSRTVVVDAGRLALVVTLSPAGLLTFREKGCRRSYDLPVYRAFRIAVEADQADKKHKAKP